METHTINPFWRLSEDTPGNLGLACTDNGLLLGKTLLIERHDGRYVVRARPEIERLLKCAYAGDPPIDRLMSGLANVAAAMNADDPGLARIAAVHLKIPDLASLSVRDALASEDVLIKYTRDEGSGDWNPALHPRAGVPPNPGWFAPTGGSQRQSSRDQSSPSEPRQRFAANEDDSRRSDAAPTGDASAGLAPGNPFDEPTNFTDRFRSNNPQVSSELWSEVWPGFKNWLQQPVPEYDLESGEEVGQRPRWQAIAPYVGIPAATAAVLGAEAFAPAVAAWLGTGGAAADVGAGSSAASVAAGAEIEGPRLIGSFAVREDLLSRPTEFGIYAHGEIAKELAKIYDGVPFIFRVARGQTGVDVEVLEQEWIDAVGFRYAEIKPLSASGEARFNRNVFDWNLPAPVQPIAYDKAGRFFWGFR